MSIADLIKKGRELHANHEYEKAIELFEKIISNDSKNAEAWFNKGRSIGEKGELEEDRESLEKALFCYETAIQLDSTFKEPLNNKSVILTDMGKLDEALDCIEKTLQIDKNYTKGWRNKAEIFLKKDDKKKAEEALAELISHNPNDPYSYVSKGYFFLTQEHFDEAMQYFNKALEIKENDPDALAAIGNTFHKQRKFTDAIIYYNKVLKIDPFSIYILLSKGYANLGLRHFDESLFCFQKAREIYTLAIEPSINIGYVLFWQKKYEDALSYFNEILKMWPKNLKALDGKASCFLQFKKYSEAIECYRNIVEINETPTSLNSLSWALSEGEKVEEALFWINKISKEKLEATYVDTKGYVYYKKKEYDKSLELFDRAIGMNHKDGEFWYHKGLVQIQRKDFKDATRCLEESIKLKPELIEARNALAIALWNIDKLEDAIENLKVAVTTQPSYFEAHENLVKLLRWQGRSSQNAWEFWTQSWPRMAVAITLGILASALVIYPIVFGFETKEILDINGKPSQSTTKYEYTIPETHLIIIGMIIFVILSPEIRKAKLGPMEFDLGHSSPSALSMGQSGSITVNYYSKV